MKRGREAVYRRENGVNGLHRISDKRIKMRLYFGCDHTSTNAPDPIRTPQLSVLGRE